jgi:hypothetical protein
MDAMKSALQKKMAMLKERHDHEMDGDGVAEHLVDHDGDSIDPNEEARESLAEKLAEQKAGDAQELHDQERNPEMAPPRGHPGSGGLSSPHETAVHSMAHGSHGGSPFAQKVQASAKARLAEIHGKTKGKY